jgi:hypothetical protein
MSWRLARSLEKLRSQVNSAWPRRSKVSDGSIGDARHSAQKSDHNPDPGGVVRALDITHDPVEGPDSEKLANALLASRDPRIKYIISNKKIASGAGGTKPWVWRPYDGANAHSRHVHISVVPGPAGDDTADWKIGAVPAPAPEPDKPAPPINRPLLAFGASNSKAVADLQRLLNARGRELVVDGDFGPKTRAAVKAFQEQHGLEPDAVVGIRTWAALG